MHAFLSMLASSLLLFTPPPDQPSYIEVAMENGALQRLVHEGFDVGGVDLERRLVSVLSRPGDRARLERAFRIVNERPAELRPDAQYQTPDKILASLRETELKYPHLAALQLIGKSVEGRDIFAIQLTNRFVVPESGEKPAILFDAMHHAREVMTPEVALDIIDYLTKNYATDAAVRKWMDSYSIWVVPMVNPDGNNKVWTQDSYWRKNARGGYGVDINRNYPYEWGACNGSSSLQTSDTYRGPSPASEPETNALISLVTDIKPVLAISYHSYSEIVIYPFGCSPKHIPESDRPRYEGLGKELAKSLVRDSGSGSYEPGTSYELLYNVDGGSIDWVYDEAKTFAYVIEVNSPSQGFQPSYNQWRKSTVERQRKGWQLMLDKMASFSKR